MVENRRDLEKVKKRLAEIRVGISTANKNVRQNWEKQVVAFLVWRCLSKV